MSAVKRNFFVLEQVRDDDDEPCIALFPDLDALKTYIGELISENNLEYPEKSWTITSYADGIAKRSYVIDVMTTDCANHALHRIRDFTHAINNISDGDTVIDNKGRIFTYDSTELSGGFYHSPLESGTIYLTRNDTDYINYLKCNNMRPLARQIEARDIAEL